MPLRFFEIEIAIGIAIDLLKNPQSCEGLGLPSPKVSFDFLQPQPPSPDPDSDSDLD